MIEFLVFASADCGDAYCVDTNSRTPEGDQPIVLFSHEQVQEDAAPSDFLPLRVDVAASLAEFLFKFADGTLNENAYG